MKHSKTERLLQIKIGSATSVFFRESRRKEMAQQKTDPILATGC